MLSLEEFYRLEIFVMPFANLELILGFFLVNLVNSKAVPCTLGLVGLAESDQVFKSWYSLLPCLTFSIKRDSVKISRQVRLLCLWARYLTGLPLPLSG